MNNKLLRNSIQILLFISLAAFSNLPSYGQDSLKRMEYEEFVKEITEASGEGQFSENELRSMYAYYRIFQSQVFTLELDLPVEEKRYLSLGVSPEMTTKLVAAYKEANYPVLSLLGVKNKKSFFGSECSEDCSGHFAGYEWAALNNIAFRSECFTQSRSFTSGCEIYIEGY